MSQIYWITRFDGILCASAILLGIISFILVVLFCAWGFSMANGDFDYGDNDEKSVRKILIRLSIVTFFLIGVVVFVPSTKEAIAIYGGGKVLDYIESNEKCKEMPDKIIDLTDKYIETLNKELDKVE